MSLFRNLLIDKKRRRFYCEVEFITFGEGQYIMYNGEQFPSQPSTIYKYGNLLPVLDWSYVPCMYDKVSGRLFYNQGSGSFTYGREIHYVDYLESTGTQYINTGLLSTASSTVDTEFSFTSMESGVANNIGVFGGRNGQQSNTFTFFKIASGNPQYFRFDYNAQTTVGTETEMTWNTASKYRFQYNGTNCITTNTTTGESVITPRSPASTFTTNPICLFAVNTGGAIGQYLSGRIYYYKYSDGTKSVDMVPAIDENGVGFMFDRVQHTIYDNAGTGAFKYPAREIEYIECVVSNTNKPYINTGVYATENTRVLAKLYTTDTNNRNYFGGSVNPIGAGKNSGFVFNAMSTTKVEYLFGAGVSGTGWTTVDATNVVGTPFDLDFSKDGIIVNGVNISTPNYSTFATQTLPVTLFVRNGGSAYINGRIYYFKMYENGTIIRDLIPTFQDGVAGMWDKENNVFYTNAGSGTFGVGKVKEPLYE